MNVFTCWSCVCATTGKKNKKQKTFTRYFPLARKKPQNALCICAAGILVLLTFIQSFQLFVSFKWIPNCRSLLESHKRRAWPPSQQHALTKQNVWVFYKPFLLCKTARSLHWSSPLHLGQVPLCLQSFPLGCLSHHIRPCYSKNNISACLQSFWPAEQW